MGFPCNVLNFFCELQSSAAQHARVTAHIVVERTERLRAGITMKCPVAGSGMKECEKRWRGNSSPSKILICICTLLLHALRELHRSPGLYFADDAAIVHDEFC